MTENEQGYTSLRIAVPTEFETVFSHFYIAENKSTQSLTKILLPAYQTILIFCFGNNASLTTKQNTKIEVEKCLVLGPIKQAFEYTLPVNTGILVANFKDDAFYRFFGTAIIAEHLPINPDVLLAENCFTNLWHQLKNINSTNERVSHILEFCKPYLRNQDNTTSLLSNFKDETRNPIKSIAEKTNQSERNIQLKQKEQFGYSAKEINRYQRFLKAIKFVEEEIAKAKKVEWFDIIEYCNYYDQSQLIHDFRHFMNISPTQYLKFQQDICNPKSE
ncbi:helix-turn-helix domain-containing protein [Flavitalea flava]